MKKKFLFLIVFCMSFQADGFFKFSFMRCVKTFQEWVQRFFSIKWQLPLKESQKLLPDFSKNLPQVIQNNFNRQSSNRLKDMLGNWKNKMKDQYSYSRIHFNNGFYFLKGFLIGRLSSRFIQGGKYSGAFLAGYAGGRMGTEKK